MKYLTTFMMALALGMLSLGCGGGGETTEQAVDPGAEDPNLMGPNTDGPPDKSEADKAKAEADKDGGS